MKETRNFLNINVLILTKGNPPINKQLYSLHVCIKEDITVQNSPNFIDFLTNFSQKNWPRYHGNGYEKEGMMHDLRVLAWKQTVIEKFIKSETMREQLGSMVTENWC